MTVKMCMDSPAGSIDKDRSIEMEGIYRRLDQQISDQNLRYLKKAKLKMIMLKKSKLVKTKVQIGSAVNALSGPSLLSSHHRIHYGLNGTITRRPLKNGKHLHLLHNVDNHTTASKVQVKNMGDS